jgi:hypothetical protein
MLQLLRAEARAHLRLWLLVPIYFFYCLVMNIQLKVHGYVFTCLIKTVPRALFTQLLAYWGPPAICLMLMIFLISLYICLFAVIRMWLEINIFHFTSFLHTPPADFSNTVHYSLLLILILRKVASRDCRF